MGAPLVWTLGAAILGGAGAAAWLRRMGSRWRTQMVERARYHVRRRTPYQWGGGHQGPGWWGLDCSGLVIDCAAAYGLDLRGWDSRRMWSDLPRVATPKPGDLACYSPRHVVIVERFDPATGIASVIGANGGGPSCTSPEAAAALGAYTRREPSHRYRSGFLGFVTLSQGATWRS